jgi:hypothetical protein
MLGMTFAPIFHIARCTSQHGEYRGTEIEIYVKRAKTKEMARKILLLLMCSRVMWDATRGQICPYQHARPGTLLGLSNAFYRQGCR